MQAEQAGRWLARLAAMMGLLLLVVASPAVACPDSGLNGDQRSYSATDLHSPVRLGVRAGGDMDLARCDSVPGSGWITRQPDLTMTLTGNKNGRRLEFRVDSACDAVLLVNTPAERWIFDDDSNGNSDPKISIPAAQTGIYDVWVGRLGDRGDCEATLTIETF
jgi:hypothetical protein